MSLIIGTPEEVDTAMAVLRCSRFVAGTKITLLRCELCGYIDGEESSPCCRKCGDGGEPIMFRVVVQ